MSLRERLKEFFTVEEVDEEEEFEEPELEVPDNIRDFVLNSSDKSVDAVVSGLEVLGLSTVEASRVVYFMGNQGDVLFNDVDPPGSIVDYVQSWYCAWYWCVLGFQVLVMLCVFVLPQVEPWIYLRYVSGAVYVLYVPGAVFIEMLYPKRSELEDLERFALGVGLSLALVPLVGLVLNYTPWGIRLNPIFAGLTLLVVSFSSAAVYRKYGYFRLGLEAIV